MFRILQCKFLIFQKEWSGVRTFNVPRDTGIVIDLISDEEENTSELPEIQNVHENSQNNSNIENIAAVENNDDQENTSQLPEIQKEAHLVENSAVIVDTDGAWVSSNLL
jgi:hypothetical protein